MTKKERIAELEKEVASLRAAVDALWMLQRRDPVPTTSPSVVPQRWDYQPYREYWYPIVTYKDS